MIALAVLLGAHAQAEGETAKIEIELFKPAAGEDPLRNPYLSDHRIHLPRSISPQCGITDMYGPGGCWDPLATPYPSGPEVGLTCEKCCLKTQKQIEKEGTCWDFVPTPSYVQMNDTEEYCCKGRMRPSFASLKQKVVAASQSEGVREPECPRPGSPDAIARYKSLSHEEFGCFLPHLGFGCEACCFNPATHPVQWSSSQRELVIESACWKENSPLQGILMNPIETQTPYEWWEECCMALCPPEMSLLTCAIMPWVHVIALGFFASVIAICFIFERALVANLLCFRNPPQDEDPFALFGAADKEEESGNSKKNKSAKKSSVAPSPAPGAGAME